MAVEQRQFGNFVVTKASDAARLGYCILLYSRGGGGKTTLAGSADDSPDDSPVLFLDAEGGTKAISHRGNVDVITVKDWTDIKRVTADIVAAPELEWKTIVLDNLSEYVQLATTKIVGNATDQVSQPKYGDMAREVLALVRTYRDLARHRGVNVVIIAWDSPEKDETGKLMTTINATPKLQKDLPGIVDIIGYISPVDGRPDLRLLSFEPSSKTISKFRRNTSDAARTIPFTIYYSLDNLPLPDIFAALKRGVNWPESRYPRPVANSR